MRSSLVATYSSNSGLSKSSESDTSFSCCRSYGPTLDQITSFYSALWKWTYLPGTCSGGCPSTLSLTWPFLLLFISEPSVLVCLKYLSVNDPTSLFSEAAEGDSSAEPMMKVLVESTLSSPLLGRLALLFWFWLTFFTLAF